MLNIRKGIKKLISYVMVLVLTAASVGAGHPADIRADDAPTGYHYETTSGASAVYSIVQFSVDGYMWHSCSHGRPGNNGNYIYTMKTHQYGFYDAYLQRWVHTTSECYEFKERDAGHSCDNVHYGIHKSNEYFGDDGNWSHSDAYKDAYHMNSSINAGGTDKSIYDSYVFTDADWKTGTVTVTYSDGITVLVPNSYTITFNPNNGGNAFAGTAVYDTGDCNVASAHNPSLDGYTFGGWYTGANGTGEQVYDKDGRAVNGTYWSGNGSTAVWKGTTNISVYAYWTAANTDVTLYFYKDGVKDDSKTKTYSVKNGSTFNATDHVADSTFDNCHYVSVDRTSWKVPDEGTYTNVYYETNELNVMYEGNGSTGGATGGSSVKYGGTVTISGNGFTKTGHSFNGWNTSADGTGTSYPAGSTFTAKPSAHGDTLRLFAQWKADKWNVTLHAGAGIDSVSGGGSHAYNESVEISAAVKKGYSWDKWTGYAETSSNSYRFNMPASDVSFTANAVPNKYTVTFDANGGSCVDGSGQAVQSVTVTYGSPDYNDISGNVKVSRPGYTFAGWVSDTAGSRGTVWNAAGHAVDGAYWNISGNTATWNYAGSITVYAVWKDATPPTVSVSPESISSYTTSLSVTVTVTDNELLSTDNTYEYCLGTDGSAPSSGASWNSYRNGGSFTIGSTLSGTYYMWVKHVKDAAGNTSVSSPNTDYHRFGPYYFDNTVPDLSGVLSSYPDLNQYPYGWYPEGTAVTFDISDAHSGVKSAVLTDFNGIPLDNGDITSGRQYYFGSEGPAFYCLTVTDNMGNTAKKLFIVKIDSKGEVIPDNAVWKGLGNLALFAHWSANSYTVHFEKNDNDGGSTKVAGSMPDATFTYDRDETLPANGFSRTGYYFDEWNESADGTANNGNIYPDKATVRNLTLTPGGKVTLYAQWKPCRYTLKFDYSRPENATGIIRGTAETSRMVTFDSAIGRLPEPKLTGWVFEGWYVDEDGTSVRLDDSDIWHYTADKTAVAKWTPVKYEVRLHSSVPEDTLGQLKQELDVSTAAGAESWIWREAEYYSAIFTYDSENSLPLPQDTYSLTEYSISGWYANELLSDYIGGGEFKKWNLSAVEGTIVDLYPAWRDTSAPEINVTPTRTVNPDADNDAVKSLAVTISVTEHGSGLRSDNRYEYGFSESSGSLPSAWESYCNNAAPSGFTVTLPDTGTGMDGYYYLWVRRVMDNSGNSSESPSALITLNGCHVFGIYVFDNTAPDGKTEYIENNLTLGLYNDTVTDSPYAVMTIHDPHDDIAGIAGYVLRISDAASPSNSVDYSFTPDAGAGTYTCSFNLYDSLSGAEDIEKVHLQIIATDKLGNEATIPITRYDFGTLQTGAAIRAEDIGYRELPDIPDASSSPLLTSYKYIRDYFRVEAYIENISYKASGTTFMGGHKGQLRIYVFGYVDNVSADFGSVKKFIIPEYDTNPDLSKTGIVPPEREKLYLHRFFVPLYCASSTYTDTTAFGYKGNSVQKRSVIYDVSDTLAYKIKTILKYNAR